MVHGDDDAAQTVSTLEARQCELDSKISSLTATLTDRESTIDALRLQVATYHDDFQTERHDRERAHGLIAELQAQISQLLHSQHRASAGSAAPQVRQCQQVTLAV